MSKLPFLSFFVFVFGLFIGSFLNCLIYRLEQKKSFLKGRSYCPHCKHILGFWDLIPLLSFIFLKGRCRYCSKKISWQYPLIELASGLIFFSIFSFLGFSDKSRAGVFSAADFLTLVYYWLICSFLVIVFVYDLKHYIVPDKVICPAILAALIFNFWLLFSGHGAPFRYSIFSAFGAGLFFFLIVFLSKGKWMGAGDIKLVFLMGLFLGFPKILVALFFSFFLGAIIGIGLIIAQKKSLKSEVPFAPFLAAGTLFAMFFGGQVINFYLAALGV